MPRRDATELERRRRIEQAAAHKRAARARWSWVDANLRSISFIVAGAIVVISLATGSPVGGAAWVPAIAGVVLERRRRARLKDAAAVLAADRRPPILYLRPFGMDKVRARRSWTSRIPINLRAHNRGRYEEWLARRMCGIGPFVTVGDPTEGLPRDGAARLYAHDAIWQAAVDDLVARAGTVILHVGRSPGLAWEVQRVVQLGDPERVLLSMPLGGVLRRTRHYAAFRARFDDVFPGGLPRGVRGTHFVYFDADWAPQRFGDLGALPPLPRPGPGEQRAEVLRKLAPDFRRMWAPRWARLAVYFVLAMLTLDGLFDPRYFVLVALGALLVAIAATPRPSPIAIDATSVRTEVARSTLHSVPPPVAAQPRAAVRVGGRPAARAKSPGWRASKTAT